MNVKEAVLKAASYVADMESISISSESVNEPLAFLSGLDFAIEGVRFDEVQNQWIVDVGFVRSWDRGRPAALAGLSGTPVSNLDKRTYKEVTISDDNGDVVNYGSSSNY